MADINSVTLVGRLTRDAELKYTSSGQAVCKFAIAINRRRKVGEQWEDEPNYFEVVLWGRQGEALNQYLLKGKQVGVEGELRQDRWQKDGQNRSKVEVVANNVMLLGGGSGAQGGGGQGPVSGASWKNKNGEAPPDDNGFTDDIPF